jgi:hypothetical protein
MEPEDSLLWMIKEEMHIKSTDTRGFICKKKTTVEQKTQMEGGLCLCGLGSGGLKENLFKNAESILHKNNTVSVLYPLRLDTSTSMTTAYEKQYYE